MCGLMLGVAGGGATKAPSRTSHSHGHPAPTAPVVTCIGAGKLVSGVKKATRSKDAPRTQVRAITRLECLLYATHTGPCLIHITSVAYLACSRQW